MLPKDGFSFDSHDHKTGKKNSQTQQYQARSPKSLKGQSGEDIVHSLWCVFVLEGLVTTVLLQIVQKLQCSRATKLPYPNGPV